MVRAIFGINQPRNFWKFPNFQKALGQFIPNGPPKHVITSTNTTIYNNRNEVVTIIWKFIYSVINLRLFYSVKCLNINPLLAIKMWNFILFWFDDLSSFLHSHYFLYSIYSLQVLVQGTSLGYHWQCLKFRILENIL